MWRFEPSDVIARGERRGLHDAILSVDVGHPALFDDDSGHYYCPYRIVGIGAQETLHYAGGVDSLQALQLALLGVQSHIDAHVAGMLTDES